MDIDYLLSLQQFREAGGQWLAPVMNILSKSAQYALLLIPVLIFWNARREVGYWYVLNLGVSDFVNNLVKLTACVYRPWVRDGRVLPWGDAKAGATGYSFPSGHTVIGTAVLGSVGVRLWRARKRSRRVLALIAFLLALLIAFSRNYLGVHTPQDVLVGILETSLVIAFNTWLLRRIHGDEKKQDLWTAIGLAAVLVGLLYIRFKPYPMEMADGAPLVDPQAMMNDAYLSAGTVLGFLAGSFWERKRIRFDASGSRTEHLVRSVVGIIPTLLIYLVLRKSLAGMIGVKAANLASMFLMAFFVTGIYPWCVMQYKKRFVR